MKLRNKPAWILVGTLIVAVAGAAALSAFRPPVEVGYAAATGAAMVRMMQDMDAARSGNADRDFAAMMIPHHRGAIEMAQAQLQYGRNERLRRLAQGIVVEQQQEIAALQAVIDEELGPEDDAPATADLCRSGPLR